MTRVVEAARRLEEAVLRLEAAARHLDKPGQRRPDQRREVEAALASAKAQYAALAQVTATVASRLDQAIGRLDRVLED